MPLPHRHRERLRGAMEASWLTAAMGALALLHFGAVFVYIARPSALGWSAFNLAAPIRWAGIVISIASAAGEIWSLISHHRRRCHRLAEGDQGLGVLGRV